MSDGVDGSFVRSITRCLQWALTIPVRAPACSSAYRKLLRPWRPSAYSLASATGVTTPAGSCRRSPKSRGMSRRRRPRGATPTPSRKPSASSATRRSSRLCRTTGGVRNMAFTSVHFAIRRWPRSHRRRRLPTAIASGPNAGLAVRDRPENNNRCPLYKRRIQFATREAMADVGVDVALVEARPIVETVTAPAEIGYDPTRVAHVSARARVRSGGSANGSATRSRKVNSSPSSTPPRSAGQRPSCSRHGLRSI